MGRFAGNTARCLVLIPAFVLGVLFPGAPVAAVETVRIAVAVNQHSITVDAPGGLAISAAGGRTLLRTGRPVRVLPGNPGLHLNGADTAVRDLMVDGGGSGVRVNGRRYGGRIRIKQTGDHLLAVNIIDVEDYLKGVVPAEVPRDWHPEALKAQAISSRTYALFQREARADREYDLVSTTQDQVYSGSAFVDAAATRAVTETRGMVMTYHGHLIFAAYHSTSAGPTEDAMTVWGDDIPYLKGVNCPFDRNSPKYQWTREITMKQFEEAMRKAGYAVGYISTVAPVDHTRSGRVGRLRIIHSRGETVIPGVEVRRILGYNELPSTRFTIEELGPVIKIKGKGWGHGVGMCQWGAKEMAEMGYSHRTILRYYYPGIRIVPISAVAQAGGR